VIADGSPARVLRDGDPARELAAHTKELDLIVTGSRGYGPLRAAHCPVIVVPRGAEGPLARAA
jgi:nucleotide-binding universal stress UspA family protein